MGRLVQLSMLSATALVLAACPPPTPRPDYPPISFAEKPPIALDVAAIEIAVPYVEPLELPHVGESFPEPPLRAARSWAEQRLRAVGERGTATVTIVEAGAVELELEQSSGLKGLFTKEQAQRYEVTVAVRVDVVDPVGPRMRGAEARVKRSITVPENADLNEREDIQYQVTKDAMADLDRAMEAQIRQHLVEFVR